MKCRALQKMLILGAVVVFLGFVNKEEPIRILALGDSITQGGNKNRPEYTYRLPLQMILHKNNVANDFVGSQKKGLQENFEWPQVANNVPFDPDHEGYYGNKTAKAVDKAIDRYNNYKIPPDFVLVHLGTNDQKHGNFEENVGEPLRKAIEFFRSKNPRVVVLLGHLNFNGGKPAMEIRKVVEEVANDMDTRKSPVKTVHHYRGWHENPDAVYTDTFDWAHPNLKGQEKMAVNWWSAMQEYMER